MARVTVVVPTYNRGAVVGRAIDSVLRQDFTDFELIVVDDGSSDCTAEVVATIHDPRVRKLRLTGNCGANAARNLGIIEATAPIIAFLDSDDEYLPNKLAVTVDLFGRQPDLGALVDSYSLIIPGKHAGRPQDKINPVIETSEDFLAALFNTSIRTWRLRKATSGISLRRQVAMRAGLFDEGLGCRQDMEFLARVAKVARCATSERQLWIKHEMPDCISRRGDAFIRATIIMCQRHPEYFQDPVMRAGLSRDIRRHLLTMVVRGGWRQIGQDVRMMIGEFGLTALLGLLGHNLIGRAVPDRQAVRPF